MMVKPVVNIVTDVPFTKSCLTCASRVMNKCTASNSSLLQEGKDIPLCERDQVYNYFNPNLKTTYTPPKEGSNRWIAALYPYFRINGTQVVLKKSCNTCQNAMQHVSGGSLYCNRAPVYTVGLTTSISQDQDACKAGLHEFWEPAEKFARHTGLVARIYHALFGKNPVGNVIDGEHVKG